MATDDRDELRDRPFGDIKHDASKGNDAVLEGITREHERLMDSIAGLSLEQATFKFAPDEWSVLETMTHMVELKGGVVQICEALARGEPPVPASAEVNATRMRDGFSIPPFATPEEASKAAGKAHQALAGFLNGVSDATNTEKTHSHPFFGSMNCLEWAVYLRIHDGDHVGQVEKIKASKGYPA